MSSISIRSSVPSSIRLCCAGSLAASLAACGSVAKGSAAHDAAPVDVSVPADSATPVDAALRSCAPPPSITNVEAAASGYGSSCIHGAWTLEALNGVTTPVAVGSTGNTVSVVPTALTAGQNTLDPTSKFAVHVSGNGQQNTATASAFAQLDATLDTLAPGDVGVVDASAYTGVQFDAVISAGAPGVRLTIADLYTDPIGGQCSITPTTPMSGCFDHPGVHIAVGTTWQHYQVAFVNLVQLGFGLPSPTGPNFPKQAIVRLKWDVGIPTDGSATPAWDLWIDNVAFY